MINLEKRTDKPAGSALQIDMFCSFRKRLFGMELDENMEYLMNKVQKEYGFSDYQIKLIRFSMTGILYDMSKILIFAVFFAATGKFVEYLFALVPLLLLRIRTGGIHMKNYWTCFLFSFVYFYIVINVLPVVMIMPPLLVYPILLLCAIANYLIGPTSLRERPAAQANLVQKIKIQTFQVVFIVAVLYFLFPDRHYLIVSFWTVVLHTFQLSITKIIKIKEAKHYEKLA